MRNDIKGGSVYSMRYRSRLTVDKIQLYTTIRYKLLSNHRLDKIKSRTVTVHPSYRFLPHYSGPLRKEEGRLTPPLR